MISAKNLISTERLIYDKISKTFSVFASNLSLAIIPNRILIQSERTGVVVGYIKTSIEKDNEGDVLYWEYRPIVIGKLGEGTKLIIFND